MRSIITITLLMLTGYFINAQNVMKVSAGTTLKTTGGATIVLQDMNLENDGTINQSAGGGGFKFSGTQNASILGTGLPVIGILEVNKTNGAKLLLNRNISINSSINFISGQLDLNGNNILMNSSAMIAGESESNRIVGPNGGFVEITQILSAPASSNPGNLGATISSNTNLGTVLIRRGHLSQSGVGLTAGIHRYYSIIAENNTNLNATLRLKYFDTELNGQNEDALVIYKSNNDGANWNNMSMTTRNANANYIEKTGMSDIFLQTLANDNVINQDGATGITLTGQRKKATEVTLKWTSQTETNMSGYQVQRKLDNEADFSDKAFVNTLAGGGNSLSQLSYQNIDANAHAGTSYYRLKILTIGGAFTYSNVVTVAGKSKGGGNGNGNNKEGEFTTVTGKTTLQPNSSLYKITVGPNPNNGHFWFSVTGVDKETTATLFTIDGKQVKQFRVVDQRQQQVSGVRTGVYLLKVPGFETRKIVVNGSGISASASSPAIENNLKF